MLPTTHQHLSVAEYRKLPEGPPHFQLIAGELYMSPSPRFWHQEIVLGIASSIREYLRRHPIGKVVVAPSDVELSPEDVYQPDIYFVSQTRYDILCEHGAIGAPDWVIEVLSPGTAQLDLGPKREAYARAGVGEFWIVRPQEGRVDLYRLQEVSTHPLHAFTMADTLSTPLLPGWSLPVAEALAR